MIGRGDWAGVGLLAVATWVWAATAPPVAAQPPPTAGAAATTEPGGGDLKRRLRDIKDAPSDKVKDVPVQDPGTRIPPPAQVTATAPERQAPPRQAREDDPTTLPVLSGEQRRSLFATPGYQQRFAELRRCREEVALARKARVSEIRAEGVELRWMVRSDGQVQGVEVVAAGPTDPDVMACVHRMVASWRIDPPPNMPYRASHRLSFARP
jgi:hypothetical protein